MRSSLVLLAALACAPVIPLAAETYDDVKAELDLTNPDDLVRLAEWCRENRRHRSATKHLREAIAIEPNHVGARTALGFCMVQRALGPRKPTAK